MADIYDISVIQGENIYLRVVALDVNQNPIDLTNYTVSGYAKYRYTDTGIVLNLRPAIHSSYISGYIDINVPETGTAPLPVMQGVYDIEIHNPFTSYTTKVIKGLFNVEPEATR